MAVAVCDARMLITVLRFLDRPSRDRHQPAVVHIESRFPASMGSVVIFGGQGRGSHGRDFDIREAAAGYPV